MLERPLATRFPVWVGWFPLVVFPPLFIAFAPPAWPRHEFMWGLGGLIFNGCKWLTWTRSTVANPSIGRHLAYWFAWAGLDANAFLKPTTDPTLRPTSSEWLFASFKLLTGTAILFVLARFMPPDQPYLVGWVGMIGTVMILHFGLFHLMSCFWRSRGVDARPIMNWPLAARSLSDFWGKRWNVAFRDLSHTHVFRPLHKRVGATWALVAVFLFSGLFHDAVVSIPAGAGYGLPMLYFVLQAMGIFVERSAIGKRIGLGASWRGWLFSALLLAGPVAILFHPPFVNEVIVPFMRAIGAIE